MTVARSQGMPGVWYEIREMMHIRVLQAKSRLDEIFWLTYQCEFVMINAQRELLWEGSLVLARPCHKELFTVRNNPIR